MANESSKIEKKWQDKWEKEKIFEADPEKKKPKFFITFPYPYQNASPHIGHAFTFLRCEFFARYKRMRGFNVLFPQGWHATGGPIVAAALRVRENDKKQIDILKSLGVKDKEINDFSQPEHWVKYFTKVWKRNYEELGMSIDWRREFFTTSLNPAYSKFVQWQYNNLKAMNYIGKGKHAVVWCPKEAKVVGDHDRPDEYSGINPEEIVIIKFHDYDGKIYPCTTYRPETVYGVTNLWVNHEREYIEAKVGSQTWIVSKDCLKELMAQREPVTIVRTFLGKELVDKIVYNPVTKVGVPILPADFVNSSIGTGVVMSVPAHAPYDYMALKDLDKDLYPISLISVEGYGEFPAVEICEKMGIKDQYDIEKLDKATKDIYTVEFHKGKLKEMFGKHAGLKVSDAKLILSKIFVESKIAESYYIVPQPVFCRCGARTHASVISDQWFLRYSDSEWKQTAHQLIDKMKFYPEDVRKNFHSNIDWLQDWACAHKNELGTPLPWDDKWVVESLSDSTIYMAYYTIAKYLQHAGDFKIDVKKLDDSFFDYVFLGDGKLKEVAKKFEIKEELLKDIRDEFLYWYPVDFRNSAKELSFNHLPFFIFHHVALFPEELWPKGIALNGWVLVEGEKMSKSKGNFITVGEAVNKWGADVLRLVEANAGSPGTDDPNIDMKFFESAKKFVDRFYDFSINNYNEGSTKENMVDKWLESILNKTVLEITKLMDETRFKDVTVKLFELQNDLSWYLRRCDKMNKSAIKNFIEIKTHLLSPFIPHTCEEIWSKIGKKGLISTAKWPEITEKDVDEKVLQMEKLVKKTADDLNHVVSIAGKKEKAFLYVVSDDEYKYMKEAEEFLRKALEFKELHVFKVSDKKKYDPQNKSVKSKFGKPGIYLE